MTRKQSSAFCSEVSSWCFNGAASAMTRKPYSDYYVAADKWLQWGRVGDDAETIELLWDAGHGTALQWGRVGDDAETAEFSGEYLKVVSLQWGRVGDDAET